MHSNSLRPLNSTHFKESHDPGGCYLRYPPIDGADCKLYCSSMGDDTAILVLKILLRPFFASVKFLGKIIFFLHFY